MSRKIIRPAGLELLHYINEGTLYAEHAVL